MSNKSETLTIRLDPALRSKLLQVVSGMIYKPSVTSVVERGIVLALDEIERINLAIEPRKPQPPEHPVALGLITKTSGGGWSA